MAEAKKTAKVLRQEYEWLIEERTRRPSWLEGSQMLEAAVHTLGKPFFSSLWGSLLADQLLLLLLLPDMWGPRVGAHLLRDPLIKYLHQ